MARRRRLQNQNGARPTRATALLPMLSCLMAIPQPANLKQFFISEYFFPSFFTVNRFIILKTNLLSVNFFHPIHPGVII